LRWLACAMKNFPQSAAGSDLLSENHFTECCLSQSINITAVFNFNFIG